MVDTVNMCIKKEEIPQKCHVLVIIQDDEKGSIDRDWFVGGTLQTCVPKCYF